MKIKERNYELKVNCIMCKKEHTLLVNVEDYLVFDMPNSPHIQDIFPYLSSAERELLISGTCDECWKKLFPPEPDEDDEDFNDDGEDCYCE